MTDLVPSQPQDVNYTTPLPSSTLAIVSLIAGILGCTVFPVVASIVAIVTGYMARQETRAIPPTASGDGMATAGIILGYVGVGLAVVGMFCFLAYMVFVVGWLSTSA